MTIANESGLTADLDPTDWAQARVQGHKMLDSMMDFIENVRDRPVWEPMPRAVRAHFREALPESGEGLDAVFDEFSTFIQPYSTGNVHPRFMGWVHGGGTVAGMLAEMLAAGLNANLGGRDHAPIAVEQQIVQWLRDRFGLPDTASGLFVTGSSMANQIAVWVARNKALGPEVRENGITTEQGRALRAYTSAAAHCCIAQAMDLAGLGTAALRIIPVDDSHRMDLDALRQAMETDRRDGLIPFFVAATAGTVDVGAIDDLDAVAAICRAQDAWFHVDGAFGALAAFSESKASLLAGIERADSIAFDFHKWGQVPYDAGFVMVRDGATHRATFSTPATYLGRASRGLAGGDIWPCDFGPDLSRGFRALKTWFTLKTYGAAGLGAVVDHTCRLASHLQGLIEAAPQLELLAPVALNIVCFRYICADADRVNAEIVMNLQEAGIAAPSTTRVGGKLAIRAAIMNHRTRLEDIDALVQAVIMLGSAEVERRLAPTVESTFILAEAS
jgi:aromatic-L-amino-acid decarboxylase